MIQGVIEIAEDSPAFVAAVGMNAEGDKVKIYWVFCPENEKTPYVILRIASNSPNQNKDDVSTVDSVTFEAYTYGRNPEETDSIDVALRFAIEGKKQTTSTVYFQRIWAVNQADGFDREAQKPYRVTSYGAMPQRVIPT